MPEIAVDVACFSRPLNVVSVYRVEVTMDSMLWDKLFGCDEVLKALLPYSVE